jgi:cob(I)alamin adenosyltransferase
MVAQPGFIQVYTGNGKGKTTAAFGLALRAAGWGMRTYVAQFLKKWETGEILSIAKHLSDFIWVEQFGLPEFHLPGSGIRPEERAEALKGLNASRAAMISGSFQMIILDEINVLLHFKILKEEPVLRLLEQKPKNVELVLTGRNAPKSILKKADLITEMKEIRHYFSQGCPARTGFER